jgi:hypothetical protein
MIKSLILRLSKNNKKIVVIMTKIKNGQIALMKKTMNKCMNKLWNTWILKIKTIEKTQNMPN